MYAQLCVRLNELAPTFEDSTSSTTTFRRLLLAKCKEEFENRTKATAVFEKDDLTTEEEEQRGVAKRKMLGNIKFIGELFNLGMLHEKIVHQCIKELLEKKRSVADTSDNLECLCHLVNTVGHRLDTEKAKGWMDQYFRRMKSLSINSDLPPRIKFMLTDTVELRDSKWTPRRSKLEIEPRPIERSPQLTYRPHPPPPSALKPFASNGERHSSSQRKETIESCSPAAPLKSKGDPSVAELRKFPSGKKSDSTVSLRPARKFQHLKPSADTTGDKPPLTSLSHSATTPSEPHPLLVDPQLKGDLSNEEVPPPLKGMHNHHTNMGPSPRMAPSFPPRPPHPMMGYMGQPSPFPPHQMVPSGALPYSGPMIPMVPPPRYPPPNIYGPPHLHPSHRPVFIPGPPVPHPQWLNPNNPPPQFYPRQATPINQQSKDAVTPFRENSKSPPIKRVVKSGKKGSSASGKKSEPSKDEKIVIPILNRYLESHDSDGVSDSIIDLSNVLPVNVIMIFINKTILSSEDSRCEVSRLFNELKIKEYLTSTLFIKASSHVLLSLSASDSTNTLARNAMAGYLARAVYQGLASLTDVTPLFNDGAHHPTVLVVLQALMNLIGQDGVQSMFQNEGIMMTSLLPSSQRSYEAISQLLETRNLGFLYPLKHIQVQLKSLLKQSDVTALAVYKWLKSNVDNQLFKNPEFIMLLTKSILGHVTGQSANNPTKEALSREKALMEEYKLIVQKLVHEEHSLQMTVIHSTQVFCHDLNFPKGLLLRLFSYWYEMDVVEEEVLLRWREDPSDQYPGKGKALFQVNQWLMLLAEAEEEDEDTDNEEN